jgi:hypothetical protein
MAPTTTTPGKLTFNDLMTKGYFPDRVIPPVNSMGLLIALADMFAYIQPIAKDMLKSPSKLRSRCVTHSVPKRKHLRRSLSIPNPLHQCMAAAQIATEWRALRKFCLQSPLSLSVPILGANRAIIARDDLSKQPQFRAQRSVGARYLLKTDIARFYPSIYTHSIPWALHGKAAARADKKYLLYGNRIDLWTRESQDKQTGGIPIGPDTSFVIGEVIGTALDLELQNKLPNLRGTRSIDDYYLYFHTVSEAETGLAILHGIAKQYELEINDPKTEIISLPDSFEPAWKSDLRSLAIRSTGQPQATDLLSLFDRAYEYAKNYPSDSVLTYAAKQVLSADIVEENWTFCESLLLRAAISEPTMLSVLGDIYDRFGAFHTDNQALTSTLESICSYHAPLQQGNEVSWALWLAKKMFVTISKAVGDKIAEVDDDIVALVALDLIAQGYLQTTKLGLWRNYMTAPNLYEDHWLLAYEAHEHGWLPAKSDYVAADPFFSILQGYGVRFYGDNLAPTVSYYGYAEDDSVADPTEEFVDDDDTDVTPI